MTVETWFILEDGTSADPREVSPDKDGVLRHKSGVAVKMRSPGVPMTRSLDPEVEREKARAKAKPAAAAPQPTPKPETRDMKPDAAQSYRTRDMKQE